MPIKIPKPLPPRGPPPINPTDDVLMKTLKAMWSTIKTNKDLLVRSSDRQNQGINRALIGPGVDKYAEIIYRSILPEAVQVMRNGNFNPRDLVSQLPPVGPEHSSKSVRGTYIYFFESVNDGLARVANASNPPRDTLYSGQSMDIPNRRSMHLARLRNVPHQGQEGSTLYRVGRSSPENGRNMVPFILFRADDEEVAHYGHLFWSMLLSSLKSVSFNPGSLSSRKTTPPQAASAILTITRIHVASQT